PLPNQLAVGLDLEELEAARHLLPLAGRQRQEQRRGALEGRDEAVANETYQHGEELGVPADELPDDGAGEAEDLRPLTDDDGGRAGEVRQHRDLAEERAFPEPGQLAKRRPLVDDGDLAARNDVERVADLPLPRDHLIG